MASLSAPAAPAAPTTSRRTRHVLVVHPGALPVGAWSPVLDGLGPDLRTSVVDLGAVRSYAVAGIDPRAVAPTVEELAEPVVELLRSDRPDVVLGWSFGGVVAQAALARDDVPLPGALVLLDSIAPVPDLVMGADFDPAVVREWFGMYLCAKQGVARPTVPVPDDAEGMCAWAVEAGALRPGTPPAGMRKVFDAYVAGLHRNNEIVRRHEARPHRVRTVLVRPAGGLLPEKGDLGWSRLHPGTVCLPCGGDHYSMFAEPGLARLLTDLVHADGPTPAPAEQPAAQPSVPPSTPTQPSSSTRS